MRLTSLLPRFCIGNQTSVIPPKSIAISGASAGSSTTRHVETKQDVTLLDRSWDLHKLSLVFVNSFSGSALDIAMNIGGGGGYESSGHGSALVLI